MNGTVKTISICVTVGALMVLICLLYFRINLYAHEEKDNIVLSFSSFSKVKNIYQMEDNRDSIKLYDMVVVVYDKNMLKIEDLEDEGVSKYNSNMIENVQYARSGRLYLTKERIENLIEFRVKNKDVGYVKFYWTVSHSYFPITCKWVDNGIKDCIKD